MGWLDRRDQRVWDRFLRSGGPTRADRLTVERPIVAWVVLTAFVGVLYALVGRLLFDDGGADGGWAGPASYTAMFAAVYVILSRRTLLDAIARWDAEGHPEHGATDAPEGPDAYDR